MKKNHLSTGILDLLKNVSSDNYKPIPFWSLNSKLEKSEIIRQIEEMHSYGLGGFVFHARTGLITEYLSEEWFDAVEVSLDTAKRLGMRVWIYDENGWPSGFVGGKLLKNEANRACYLKYAILDEYDDSAYAVYEYTKENGARLLKVREDIKGKYHTIYKLQSDAYTDILNPAVTRLFIAETHEKYYDRFASRFGKELVGFFTDEPQYFRYQTPISSVTEEEYRAQYGKNLKDGLLYLFIDDKKGYSFRVEYYNLTNRLYCENFYKLLMEWCEERGCLLTGHSVEETTFSTQMWGGADCATTYLYEHVPAIDNLEKSLTAEISAKSVGSVAAQIGQKDIFTETFGVSGYSTTPAQMKLIADKQYVYGVSKIIQHLYNYSLAGQGKIDCPPSFGRTMPWVSGYSQLNGYFEKLGYLIANSEEIAPVAVVTPMESVYLDYIRLDETATKNSVDYPFWQTLTELRRAGIAYHFVNEKIFEKIGSVNDGVFAVGKRVYKAVVLANCREIKKNTYSALKKYIDGGGKLCICGQAPGYVDGVPIGESLSGNCGIEDLPIPLKLIFDGVLSYSYRVFEGKRFLFVVNENEQQIELKTEKAFSHIDLSDNQGYAASTSHIVPAKGSILLEENGEYVNAPERFEKSIKFTPKFLYSDKNNLTIEQVTVKLDDGEVLSGYVYSVFDMLARRKYNGKVDVKFTFYSDTERPVIITREKQDVYDVLFNGYSICFRQSEEDVNFEYAEVNAKNGENTYAYTIDFEKFLAATEILYKKDVPESLLNCATYHTGLEQIYIAGDFDTDGYSIKKATTKSGGDLTAQGYSNFYGVVRYEIDLKKSIKEGYFKPRGHYSQCIVIVGDNNYRCMLERGVRIKDIPAGKIFIDCYSTLRNRIGPFHYGSAEDDRITPMTFTMLGLWNGINDNKFFYEPKRVVPFGLESVEIEFNDEE